MANEGDDGNPQPLLGKASSIGGGLGIGSCHMAHVGPSSLLLILALHLHK